MARAEVLWRACVAAAGCILLLGSAGKAIAGVPRFVAGPGWGVPTATYVGWAAGTLRYFTDQGPLSASVNHAAADAMVAAAAAVWNVPTSNLTLAQGGVLAEDVSASNVTFSNGAAVFPADLQQADENDVPLPIVYDTDGSLIDTLLGAGASDPTDCRSNAVVGDVDFIDEGSGIIRHGMLILNGLCAGPEPEQLLQMQYALARAFGRVLGLSWSQNNDNVFTAQSPVTQNQMSHWPLMHPLDVICSDETYQCMTNPFQLRQDDVNTLSLVYPVMQWQAVNGKQGSSSDGLYFWGLTYFLDGQSMGWMNITTRRFALGINEDWETVSSMAGFEVRQEEPTPVNPTFHTDFGSPNHDLDGWFLFRSIPLNGLANIFVTNQAINPLYMGDAAIGPYQRPPITPSGTPVTIGEYSAIPNGDNVVWNFLHVTDGAATCNPGADGSETAPAAFDPSGWQAGQLCGPSHNSWWGLNVAAGHAFTVEVTATDESGAPSVNKAQPVIGFWNTSDPTGTAPTVTSQVVPFNSLSYGTTQVQMPPATNDQVLRLSVSDQFGQGRPDFTYTGRVLYVTAVAPATLGSGGGQIVITGTGFRPGMQVWVGRAAATVVSTSSTQLVANAPTLDATSAAVGELLDLQVTDPATGGVASAPQVLSYQQIPDVIQILSTPTTLETGETAGQLLNLRFLASDGLSPVPGEAVTLSVTQGSAELSACSGAASCVISTDTNGKVQTAVVGGAAGAITVTFTDATGASGFVQAIDTDPSRFLTIASPMHYVAAGATGEWTVEAQALQDGLAAMGVPVTWSSGPGASAQIAGALATADAGGLAYTKVLIANIAPGSSQTVQACAWTTLCATWTAAGVDASEWSLQVASGEQQSVPQGTALGAVILSVTDIAGHPLELAPVTVHQRVLAWRSPCPTSGRCPAAAVLQSSVQTLTSDAHGQIQITPLQVAGTPEQVEIAVSAGTQSFVTVTLQKVPAP